MRFVQLEQNWQFNLADNAIPIQFDGAEWSAATESQQKRTSGNRWRTTLGRNNTTAKIATHEQMKNLQRKTASSQGFDLKLLTHL